MRKSRTSLLRFPVAGSASQHSIWLSIPRNGKQDRDSLSAHTISIFVRIHPYYQSRLPLSAKCYIRQQPVHQQSNKWSGIDLTQVRSVGSDGRHINAVYALCPTAGTFCPTWFFISCTAAKLYSWAALLMDSKYRTSKRKYSVSQNSCRLESTFSIYNYLQIRLSYLIWKVITKLLVTDGIEDVIYGQKEHMADDVRTEGTSLKFKNVCTVHKRQWPPSKENKYFCSKAEGVRVTQWCAARWGEEVRNSGG